MSLNDDRRFQKLEEEIAQAVSDDPKKRQLIDTLLGQWREEILQRASDMIMYALTHN